MSESSVEVLYRRPEKTEEHESSVVSSSPNATSKVKVMVKRSKSSKPQYYLGPPDLGALQAQLISRPVTAVDRLFYRRKSVVASIRERAEEPDKILPPGRLPIWERIHLPDKVPAPNIPNHRIVWSRGKICHGLLHQNCPEFCLDDPYNRYRVATGPYDPLHDENTKSYFQAPSVQKLLQDQGLITPRGSVPCSLTSFNNWRAQLNASVYTQKVKKVLNQIVKHKEADAAQLKRIAEYDRQEKFAREQSGRMQKAIKAREKANRTQRENLEKYEEGLKKKEERLRRCQVNMAKEQLERMIRNNQRCQKRNNNLMIRLRRKEMARQQLIYKIVEKDVEAERRLEAKCLNQQRQVEEQFESRIQAHCRVQEIENEREKFVLDSLEKEMKEHTRSRQMAYAKAQSKPLVSKAETRRMELARKYGRRWAELTAKRQLERCLVRHSSMFHLPTELGATLVYLSNRLPGTVSIQSLSPPSSAAALAEYNAAEVKQSTSYMSVSDVPDRGTLEFILTEVRRTAGVKSRSKVKEIAFSPPVFDGTGDSNVGNKLKKGEGKLLPLSAGASGSSLTSTGSFSLITKRSKSQGHDQGHLNQKTAAGDSIFKVNESGTPALLEPNKN